MRPLGSLPLRLWFFFCCKTAHRDSHSALGFPSHNANVPVHRVEDYWLGYKLFCFGYYSHSPQHVQEFRHSKLGTSISSPLSAWLFSKMHILEDIHNWLLRTAPGFSSRRATCVAQACRRYISLRTRGARHLHATSPACGDVLQVGTA